jgi:hypothetical protein
MSRSDDVTLPRGAARMRVSWPRSEDLAFEPELAPLALLDAALAVAVQALIARNPELLSEREELKMAPRVVAARHIIALYREIHDALDEYRALLPTEQQLATGTDDFPF